MTQAITLTVSAKMIGARQPLYSDLHITIPQNNDNDASPSLTLHDLITHIVTQSAETFQNRQAAQRFDRVLLPQDMTNGAQHGKYTPSAHESPTLSVDIDQAVDTALTGFVDGLYFVFIDDIQYESLAQTVPLTPNGRVMFVRLVALVGG
jgi:hypothetical protein